VHRDSITNFNESFAHEENWRGSINFQVPNQGQELVPMLGPGQRKPNYHLNISKYGDLFLDFKTTRSVVEMRVIVISRKNF
jgi:hypothetical protein